MALEINTSEAFEQRLAAYPEAAKKQMEQLRKLINESAEELESVTHLEETLKWGEPSFISKHGSTIRMDWKSKNPDQYALYFQCTTSLVPTFRLLYKSLFKFEGNRALVFDLDEVIQDEELKKCLKAGLTYHKVKHLPTLGI